jgi:Uncharacterized conserved protein
MKIITVTSQKAANYGAVLQAYALQNILISLGHENYLLNFPPKNITIYKKIDFKNIKTIIRDLILNVYTFIRKKEMKGFFNKFQTFQNEFLKSTIPYETMEEIVNNPPKADIYLSGSDQVFAMNQPIRDIRFLSFGETETKRYSYAASIDSYKLNDEQKKYFVDNLKKFNKISLREPESVEYINSITGYECFTHIDPSFLLKKEQWLKIAESPREIIPEKYILCLPLLGNRNINGILKKLKRITGYPVVCIQTKPVKTVEADYYIYDASPNEFLGLFANAEKIVTTSFHGTAFSLIFEKQFYTLITSYKPERMVSILNLLNIPERIISDENNICECDIDYTKVNEILENEIEKSYKYLQSIG